MKINRWPRNPAGCAIVLGVASAIVYLLMINTTLAQLTALSGLAPLDLRPFGYGVADVTALLHALGEEGRAVYLHRQLLLDSLYPALLALTLVYSFQGFGQSLPHRRLIRTGIALSLAAAAFDYSENIGIAILLLKWPDVPPLLVHLTSLSSIAKSLFTTSAVVLVMLTAVFWIYRRFRLRPRAVGPRV